MGGGKTTAPGTAKGRVMFGRRSEHSDSLLLVAATTLLILTARRYFQASAPRKSHSGLANSEVAGPGAFPRAISRSENSRQHPSSPFQIPWEGWKQMLWRTYGRTREDRLLASAPGVA